MKTIIVYAKKKGFNVYYRIEYDIHKSNRGYKIAVPRHAEEITKYRYYKDMSILHYMVYSKQETIHEIGNEAFLKE